MRRIARLARLELSGTEVEEHRVALSAIVAYMDRLRAVSPLPQEPLAHIGDAHTRLGEDVPVDGLPNSVLRTLAPDSWEAFVKVPKVLDEGGGA